MRREWCSAGYGDQSPPDEIHVRIYFLQQGSTEVDARIFFRHYEAKLWKNHRGRLIKNWKRLAWQWIF